MYELLMMTPLVGMVTRSGASGELLSYAQCVAAGHREPMNKCWPEAVQVLNVTPSSSSFRTQMLSDAARFLQLILCCPPRSLKCLLITCTASRGQHPRAAAFKSFPGCDAAAWLGCLGWPSRSACTSCHHRGRQQNVRILSKLGALFHDIWLHCCVALMPRLCGTVECC